MENLSCSDKNAEKIVLRCPKYPKTGSKELIVSDKSIEYSVVGDDTKKRIIPISDITKVKVRLNSTVGSFIINYKNDKTPYNTSHINYKRDTLTDEVAKIFYNHIVDNNSNIPPFDEAIYKAPGKTYLQVAGLLYILIGVVAIANWLDGNITETAVLFNSFNLLLGIFAIYRCNNVPKSAPLLILGIISLILTVWWVEYSFSLAMALVLAVPTVFIIGALKNYTENKAQRLENVANDGGLAQQLPSKSKKTSLLYIASIIQVVFSGIILGVVLVAQVFNPHGWVGFLTIFVIFSFYLFTGIFGIKTFDDLMKARILRVSAIVNTVLFAVFQPTMEAIFHSFGTIIGLAIPILIFAGAQVNYAEYKKKHQN